MKPLRIPARRIRQFLSHARNRGLGPACSKAARFVSFESVR